MTGDWERIKETFLAASELSPEMRAAYLDQACGGDHKLRQAVDELLQWSAEPAEFKSPIRTRDLTGQTIGRYRILGKLGQGGMGVVYKAEDSFLGRTVVLKFLMPEVMADSEFRERFLHEAKAAAAFDHPNICTLYGIEEFEGATFLVMAYIGGKTLKERIQSGPMPPGEALRIAAETALGLREAHRKGVVHRDVKPSNILLAPDGRAVIADFGLAQFDNDPRITRHGEWMGTPAYMAPEQIRGEKATPRSDIWALGVVLYEMIAGRLPFSNTHIPSLILAIQDGSFEALSSVRPDAPPELDRTMQRMLARKAEERFPDAEAALENFRSLSAVPPASGLLETPPRRAGARRTWMAAVAGVLVVAAVILWRFAPSGAPVESPETVPLSSYSGMEDNPTFSPDSEQVAFSWRPEGSPNSAICVKLLRDEKQHCLTSGLNRDTSPAWSPDGRWIAFVRRLSPRNFGIYLISPLGGQERQVTEITGRDGLDGLSRAAWTPDSTRLVFSDKDPKTDRSRLWLLSIDSLQRTALTSPPAAFDGDRSPSVSPDGRTVVFVREGEIFGDLFVQQLAADYSAAGEARQLTFDNRFIVDPVWTRDGAEILFASSEAMSWSGLRIWRVPASGIAKPSLVPLIVEGSYSPAFSADGRRLAFTRYQNDQNIWRIDRDSLTSPWQPPKKFSEISSTRDDGFPTISPDGSRIAFVSNRAGGFDVWVSHRDGSNARQRTFLGALSGTLTWSPDGKQIAFDRNIDGNWDVYVVGADGGQPRRLTMDSTSETVDTWSRDGRYVYINSMRTPEVQIWKIPAQGGDPLQVTSKGGYFGIESTDGEFLYYSVRPQGGPLRRLALKTGEDIQILDSVHPVCFAVTTRGIFFMPYGSGKESRSDFNYLDFRTRRVTHVAKADAPVSESISVAPDELTILYAQRDQLGSDLMLINNFR
jgi:serine/threonine protein kinase